MKIYWGSGCIAPCILNLGTWWRWAVTNKNCFHQEITGRLNVGKACYHSFQNISSSHLISENLMIKIYKIIILPVVLYWCEPWPLVHEVGDDCLMRSFITCTLYQMLLGWQVKEDEMGRACSTKFWFENLKVRDSLWRLGIDGRITLEWMLRKQGEKVWTGFVWLRLGSSGGLLWIW
jgi:hypothetical protein